MGFHHLVENTIWREVFQEIDMYSSCNQRDILRELRPEILADPEFQGQPPQAPGDQLPGDASCQGGGQA